MHSARDCVCLAWTCDGQGGLVSVPERGAVERYVQPRMNSVSVSVPDLARGAPFSASCAGPLVRGSYAGQETRTLWTSTQGPTPPPARYPRRAGSIVQAPCPCP